MFDERTLSGELDELRRSHAPSALVFDARGDFETLPPSVVENLLAVTDGVEPLSYDESWLPEDAPETLYRIAGNEFTIGAPGDGGVVWTRQTTPPVVLVKPRLEGSPEGFIDFLIAEALVEIGLGGPEHFLGFFEDDYRELAEAVPLSPADTYQLAAALFTASVGRSTRPIFAGWADELPALHAEWVDAGERLEPGLSGLSGDVALGRTSFSDAAELACSAVKHDIEIPTPFVALDSPAYDRHGAAFAVRWAEKTFEALETE
ncbi:DUF7089 family protein [Natronomonas salsuginis]|uniref:Uncharacterized protein n=1 Tax=Natronomonas salsuginis TaxID=2217661 RepID=A0A4U5JAQ4_9EURY|nr:hypothetical protein [Natronomonas salsuginis]TKR25645.1 hypothetical protein DM868_09540 [Natronomonas salsuginis]